MIPQEISDTRPVTGSHQGDAAQPKLDPQTVLGRLDAIEALLGISPSPQSRTSDDVSLGTPDAESPFQGVYTAAAHLKLTTRPPQSPRIWSRVVINQLWLSYDLSLSTGSHC